MKTILHVFLTVLAFAAIQTGVRAQTAAFQEYSCERYTDLGGGKVRLEIGTLFKSAGFIPTLASDFNLSDLSLSGTTLRAISGKTVDALSQYLSLTGIASEIGTNFARSTETYSVQGGVYVIITVRSGSIGTGGANTGGTTTPATLKPVNVSTLTLCPAGGAVTAGFVLEGAGSQQVLIRAVGPTLRIFNVGGPLANPKLTVNKGQSVIGTNDDWGSDPVKAAALTAAFTASGAFALPAGSRDAAVLVTLDAGSYTAQAASVDAAASGQVIVEVYILK